MAIENPQAIKTVNMALLTGAAVEVHDPFGLLSNRIPNARAVGPGGPLVARVFVDDRLLDAPPGALILRPPSLVAGIGCNRGTAADEIRELLLATLRDAGLCRASLRGLASIDLKADEPGLIALAQELGLPLEFFGREDDQPGGGRRANPFRHGRETHRSEKRMRSHSHTSDARRGTDRAQADDPQRDGRHRTRQLYIVGIGPGSLEHLTLRATEVLKSVDCVAGYSLYVDLIEPLIADTPTLRSGMMKEVERVEAAIATACGGTSCALVSSGDPGIYAMAGLVFETCKIKNIPVVRPGAPAAGGTDGTAHSWWRSSRGSRPCARARPCWEPRSPTTSPW